MQDLIDLNEWFRHAIIGVAQGPWIVWLRVVGELRVEDSGSKDANASLETSQVKSSQVNARAVSSRPTGALNLYR